MFSFRFTIPDDRSVADLSFDQCQHQLAHWQDSQALDQTQLALIRRYAQHLMDAEQYIAALKQLEEALAIQPDDSFTRAYYGLVLERLGMTKQSTAAYQRAISDLTIPSHPLMAQLWYRQGVMLRTQGQYSLALNSYNQSLAMHPLYAEALSGRGVILALLGQHKAAQSDGMRAVSIAPDSPQVLNNSGVIFLTNRRYHQALGYFNRVLDLEPDFERALYNKALIFSRLGQDDDAIAYLNQLLNSNPLFPPHSSGPFGRSNMEYIMAPSERWRASAWILHGFHHLKNHQFQTTIHSCRHAQRIQPTLYLAALYKLTAAIASGQVWQQLKHADGRQELGHDIGTIINTLKYRLFALVGIVVLLVWGQGAIADTLRQGFPTLLSMVILALVGFDLWRNKSRLAFVGNVYFRSGFLTYLRAAIILMTTLLTFNYAYTYAPKFMRWGWANVVFGASGNIIFQPINLIQNLSLFDPDPRSPLESLWATIHPVNLLSGLSNGLFSGPWEQSNMSILPSISPIFGFVGTPLFHIGPIHITVGIILILLFWLALILGVPFWANLEERMFRQGANTWRTIAIRSTQFGLMHLLAGIPILAGFVLIVPGFLFACRYKYVRDRHYHRHHNPRQADAAGVIASTADHAIYNAILITFAISTIVTEQLFQS